MLDFHSFVAAGMAPETIGEPTRPVNTGRFGFETANQLVVLHRRAQSAVPSLSVAIPT